MQAFCNIGYIFVAVFFFWSGFGLVKSLNAKPGYLDGFMRRRVVKVLVVPFYISVVIYALPHLLPQGSPEDTSVPSLILYALRFVPTGISLPPMQWVCNFLGVTMMNEYAWYPIVAGILYTAFYVFFKNIKNRRLCFVLMAAVILLMGLFFCVSGHFAWWAGTKNWWLSGAGWAKARWWMGFKVFWFSGEWWVNSCPAFLVGMLAAQHEEHLCGWLARAYWPKLALLVLLVAALTLLSGYGQMRFGYWTEFNGKGPGILNKLLTYLMQIPQPMAVVLLMFAVMLKYHASNPVTRFFGGISLETYMMNLMALSLFRFLLYKGTMPNGDLIPFYWRGNGNLALYAAAVIAATLVLALLYRLLNALAARLLRLDRA
jgi:peptidoglycan/LPS O-acetylase OafA/YrhL